MSDWIRCRHQQRETDLKSAKETIKDLAGVLRQRGFEIVELIYSGSNDEGFINEVSAYLSPSDEPTRLEEEIENKLREAAYSFLPPGFEINGGSEGVIAINLSDATVKVHHNHRLRDPFDY